ncbi:hypothetical protein Q8791_17030 [Nocardiopsis sp. CT-R113]|uniref:Uncharacterized protein n=1 Tax=Nocardiopsis codii TaxID=3065942 RepID=A0ABU7KAI9_9ACTN|nr:hypothetical protein [Nocardiopsis sp. CT-R113]MEE2038924.1 hypothetical protein [Nocardiopsis sp. CT-R113]
MNDLTRGRFHGQEVTVAMLHELRRTGPGGLIVADGPMAPFEVIHSRDMDLGCPSQVIIYGHGDLTHELACEEEVWAQVASEATDNAYAHLYRWFFHSAGRMVRTLREDMRSRGMDLTNRPVVEQTEDGVKQVQDIYALRGEPRITFNADCVQRHRDSFLVSLAMHDEGRFVTSWPERVTLTGRAPRTVREAPSRAALYLETHP